MDVNKVLLDYENESDIPESEDKPSKFRYSVINAAVGFIAKTVHKAAEHKPYVGKQCYSTSAVVNFFKNGSDYFDVEIE